MRLTQVELSASSFNPLDILEDVLTANELPFNRLAEDQLILDTLGQWCDYRMFFLWRTDLNALYFSCTFDGKVLPKKKGDVNALLALANEKLWLGHFEICSGDLVPMFRHTLLARGVRGIAVEQFEDLIEIAIGECDRFFPAFQFVLWGGKSPKDALDSAMLETVGEG